MDISHDLDQIADLIEMSFPIHLDPDGQVYIQKMRKTARDMHRLEWLSPWADMSDVGASGFVWEEENRIVGNLSLIPFQNDGRRTYLIANVAVHPSFRRRGIARALTKRALGYLRRRNSGDVWLQVRDDNQDAQELYRSVGFIDRAARTTWRIKPNQAIMDKESLMAGRYLRKRKPSDWQTQSLNLDQAYPRELRWNYPVHFSSFSPGFGQQVTNFMEGVRLRHWTYDSGEMGQGQITWQKTDAYANNLWLAFNETDEADLIAGALLGVFQQLSQDHPVSIDYPKGRAEMALESLGFKAFRTLIWMACRL